MLTGLLDRSVLRGMLGRRPLVASGMRWVLGRAGLGPTDVANTRRLHVQAAAAKASVICLTLCNAAYFPGIAMEVVLVGTRL